MVSRFVLAALTFAPLFAQSASCMPGFPCYSAAGLANSASNTAGPYSPNSFISIYGTNLSNVTKALGPSDIDAGQLPWALTGTDVSVLVGGISGYIYYVSPEQVNVLIPSM